MDGKSSRSYFDPRMASENLITHGSNREPHKYILLNLNKVCSLPKFPLFGSQKYLATPLLPEPRSDGGKVKWTSAKMSRFYTLCFLKCHNMNTSLGSYLVPLEHLRQVRGPEVQGAPVS